MVTHKPLIPYLPRLILIGKLRVSDDFFLSISCKQKRPTNAARTACAGLRKTKTNQSDVDTFLRKPREWKRYLTTDERKSGQL